MANSVDPDQTPHSAASNQVYIVCSRLSIQIFRVITVHSQYKQTSTAKNKKRKPTDMILNEL